MIDYKVCIVVFIAHVLGGEGQGSSYNGWTQQYSDPSSTSYTEYIGSGFKPGWNFTTQPFVSQTSPCVDHYGVLYYPLRANILAIGPNGAVLWKTGVSPNGNSYLTNILYSYKHDFVIVGSSWVDQETFFQLVAVHVNNGSVAWTSYQNQMYHATTMSISVSTDAVYVGGYDLKSFSAVGLEDGKLIWEKKNIYQVGIFMQTKVGPASSVGWSRTGRGVEEERMMKGGEEIVLLPTDPWNGFGGKGRLFAYNTGKRDVLPTPSLDWQSDLGFTAGALFAFSSINILYGSNGGSVGSKGALFFVNSTDGSLLYNDDGYCDRGPSGLSGPAVDSEGFVYYSCGNQVFSLNTDGSLRWQSDKFGNSTLGSVTPPSIHPEGLVYFIHQNGTVVYCLATKDGSVSKTYVVPKLGYFEPPILVGSKFMYAVGFEGSAVAIVPVEL